MRPGRALIAESGAYREIWRIDSDAPIDKDLKPGTWRYASEAHREAAEREAQHLLDGINEDLKQYNEWMALPLIVLAGLR